METTHYIDGYQYLEDKLSFFPTAEGYVNVTHGALSPAYNYVYNYTDHLGNIRLRYTKNPGSGGGLRILEEDHYYPFGLKHQGYNGEHKIFDVDIPSGEVVLITPTPFQNDKYKYKFNGMEWQDEMDLNFYDFGFRNYDPALGRWMNIDPLAEVSRRWSPYTYAYNNPIYFIDPDGMEAIPQAVTWAPTELYTLTTLDGNGETLHTKTVSSLADTNLEMGWNEGADGRDLGGGDIKPIGFHSFVPDKNKNGVELDVGTDIIIEYFSVSSESVDNNGNNHYNTVTVSTSVKIDLHGNILYDDIQSKVIDWSNINGTNVYYISRDFNSLSENQKEAAISTSTYKMNEGHSPLKNTAENRNIAFGATLGLGATLFTLGQSAVIQAGASVTGSVTGGLIVPYNQNNIIKRLY